MAKPEEIKLLDIMWIRYKNVKDYYIICLYKDEEKIKALVDDHTSHSANNRGIIPPYETKLFIQFTKLNNITNMPHSEVLKFIKNNMRTTWSYAEKSIKPKNRYDNEIKSYRTFFLKDIVILRNFGPIK